MNGTIEKTIIYEYAQAIQALRLSLRNIESPYIACFLAIVFKDADEKESLEMIISWLYEYISPYVFSEPRNQTDLREKTLAIAIYIYLEEFNNSETQLPEEYIIKYVEYASTQEWYSDTLLAFISSLSSNKYTTCEMAKHYLQERLPVFVSQQNIEAVCQSLYVQSGTEDSEILAELNLIKNWLSTLSVQSFDYAWSLLGFSNYIKNEEDYKLLARLKNFLYRTISIISDSYISQSFSFLSDMLNKTNLTQNYGSSKNKSSASFLSNCSEDNEADNQETPFSPTIDWSELGLITACLCLSKCNYSINIVGYSEDKITKILNESMQADKGFVRISRPANIIGNLLAIISTFSIGIVGCIYLFGIHLENANIKFTSNPGLGDLLLILTWGDYLLSQIQSLMKGESALEGMTKIPFVRYIGSTQRRKDV